MANRIYRGPSDRQPRTVSDKPLSAAATPGILVAETATQLVVGGGLSNMNRILADRDFFGANHFDGGDHLKTAYAANETAVAYVMEPGQRYQMQVASGSYTFGQTLTRAAGGRLGATASGNIIIAYYVDAAGTKVDGDLVDVEIANFHTVA